MDASGWPDAFMSKKLLVVLHRTDHAVYLLGNEHFSKIGLTIQQAVVLAFIYHHKGCNQKAVEDHINTRSASVTVLLNTMVGKGLIEKTRNPLDGRGVILSLTGKGRRTAGKIMAVFENITKAITRDMSDEEIDTLKILLRKIAANCIEVTSKLQEKEEIAQ